MNIKDFILKESKKLNIDMVKISDGLPTDFLKPSLEERIASGKITEFENTDIEEKLDINRTFDGYRSVIVIGISYRVDFKRRVDFDKGILSKASFGLDYHHVLSNRMENLIEVLKEELGGNYKAYVDTGPLVDRNLSYTSGMGYYGKNTLMISEEYGSYFFIGYIITDLDIEKDKILKSQCGSCTRCLKYCPTGALEGPYKLNPKKCISYLTQTKEKIPYELRESMGAKIYGCDTCQDVCPKNKFIKKGNHKEFLPEKTLGYVDIEEIVSISNKEFKEKYGDMAGSWRGKNILKRNAIIAMGNKKNKRYLKILEGLLEEKSQMIVEYTIWSIVKISREDSREILDRYFSKDERNEYLFNEYLSIKKYFSIK